MHEKFAHAASHIAEADGLIITAGAGLGVDSGLPDFRGAEGFWGTYPALAKAHMHFQDIASPTAFSEHPELAWGFYGHRLSMYRETEPGPAFRILLEIAKRLPYGAFVFTSNVDGHFQKSGFDPRRIVECHGSIHYLQCVNGCMRDTWSAEGFQPNVDGDKCRLQNAFPTCKWCGGIARPNILMFGDYDWLNDRSALQQQRYAEWKMRVQRLIVIEIGAGSAIPTVRRFSEGQRCPIIRINTTDAEVPNSAGIALSMNGTTAMQGIAAALIEIGFIDH